MFSGARECYYTFLLEIHFYLGIEFILGWWKISSWKINAVSVINKNLVTNDTHSDVYGLRWL